MRILVIIFTLLTSIAFCQEKLNNIIVGKYYSSIYLSKDLNQNLLLQKKLPIVSDSIYNPENEVSWTLNFLKKGKLEIKSLYEIYYYCGFFHVDLYDGYWKRLKRNIYKITWKGSVDGEKFTKEMIYNVQQVSNGDLKLMIKH